MSTFARLLGFLRPHKGRVALSAALGAATVASGVGLLATAAYVISAAAVVPMLALLAIPVFLVRFFAASRAFSRYAERLVSHDLTFRLLSNFRTSFFQRLVPLAPGRLSAHRGGDLLSRFVKDVEELENVFLRVVSPVVVALTVCLLSFFVLRPFAPELAVAAVAFLLVGGFAVPVLGRVLSRGLGSQQVRLRAELTARVVDVVGGARDLLAFNREDAERREISTLDRELEKAQGRVSLAAGLQDGAADLVTGLALLSTLVLALPLVAGGTIDGVWLAMVAIVVLGGFEVLAPLGTAFRVLGRSVSAGERLFEITDAKAEVVDPTVPLPPPGDHTLAFDRVGFRYEEDGPAVLDDVSFDLPPGGRIAVVGPSGSGKSTLANLVLRFYDPTSGAVRLGGDDARDYRQVDLRHPIAAVDQSPHVFAASIRENLLVADATADEDALWEALEKAGLAGFVRTLPGGLDEYAGDGGSRLSGGERRRLAVARALLRRAPLLLLDEPTADLDALTERELMEGILAARGGSLLLITHRLVGLEAMDEILVLDGGRVVERGTHEGLRFAGGLYQKMLRAQDGMLATA